MTSDRQSVLEELQARVADLLRASPASDIERNVKAIVGQAFQRLDLVTREEFDIQRELVLQLRSRISELESRIKEQDTSRSD